MKPLAALDPRAVRAVLFDIDDTLTTTGKLTAGAYGALEELKTRLPPETFDELWSAH